MKGFSYLKNVTTLALDRERCSGCGLCAHVCPHQVFVIRGRKTEIVARDACMECGACALNCPEDALCVDAGVGCASGILTEWWRDTFPGRRGGPESGCC
ncbi:MAG TPA: mercury methylation ferredoxin HgcB [Candidatus Deferrimicrobiaceae bacterium]|jgi:ferredoxin